MTPKGRHAVKGMFVIHAMSTSLWVNHIAAIKSTTRIDDGTLGLVLLATSSGALAGMALYGRLSRTIGNRRTVRALAVLCPLMLVPLSGAQGVATLSLALFCLGAASGLLNVAMNTSAVSIGSESGRPVIGTCHALWSISNIVGSAVATLTLLAGSPWRLTCGIGAALLVLAALFLGRSMPELLGSLHGRAERRISRRMLLLGILAMGALLCEGAVADWAGVHMHQVLDAPYAMSALAYGAFSVTATLGRLTIDRLTSIFGPARLLRAGGGLAVTGSTLAIFAPAPALGVIGWAFTGLGLSVVVPVIYGASAIDDEDVASSVARVSGLGYIGLLVGPVLIGALAHQTNLVIGLLPIVIMAALIGLKGPSLLKPDPPGTTPRATMAPAQQ